MCGKPFEAQKPTARYCSPLCSKRAQRAGVAGRRSDPVVAPEIGEASGLVDAVEKTLEAAGRLNSSMGQLALVLARKMATDHGTAAGVAALSRELSAVVAAALEGHSAAPD